MNKELLQRPDVMSDKKSWIVVDGDVAYIPLTQDKYAMSSANVLLDKMGHIAQPEQPEGDAKDAPYKAIASILDEVMAIAVSNGANSISMPGEYVEVAWWLCNQKPDAAIAQPEQTADATHAAQHYLVIERSQGIPALDAGPAAVLYSDSINGCMVRRDDVWLALTSQLAQPEQLEGDAKDAERLNWLEAQLFTHRWNSIIGLGHKVNWSVVPHYRHNQHALIGQTFREAIDAAIASQKAAQ